jgi:hypothetical protein
MKDGFLLTSAGRFTEATIYCVAPPPNQSPAPPDNVKLFASWHSGLETPSALRQWKLRLQLVPSVMGAAARLNRDPRNDRHFEHRNFGTGPTESSAAKTKPKV